MTASKPIVTLSLPQIAAWQIDLPQAKSDIVARLPALQRGAVWKPDQIEFLWDSILRRFPIGSILLSNYIRAQGSKISKFGEANPNEPLVTHHILDGQQRCNAIAMAFDLPEYGNSKIQTMLWYDLKGNDEWGKATHSRKFLFRVTTSAHPWGYDVDESSGRISHSQMEAFRETYQKCCGDDQYPLVAKSIPWRTTLPIPVGLLLQNLTAEGFNWDEIIRNPWVEKIDNWLNTRKEKQGNTHEAEQGLSGYLKNPDNQQEITAAFSPVVDTVIPAITIAFDPPNSSNENEDGKFIENIELIFSRINNRGTPIDQEELRYSMIKAYYPDVEKEVIGQIEKLPVSEARLINLGIRAALMQEKEKYQPILTSQQIRNIFREGTDEDIIKGYLKKQFPEAIKWIEDHLLYKDKSFGLPPYLRSSIAWRSQEVFLWWIMLAAEFDYSEISEKDAKRILAISLIIHWFSDSKDRVCRQLWHLQFTPEAQEPWQEWTFEDLNIEDRLFQLTKPKELEEKLEEKINAAFEAMGNSNTNFHNLWQLLTYQNDEDLRFANFASKLWHMQEFLVYIQRKQLCDMSEYDPSNKTLWETHNRPWDYDHMLPSAALNAQGRGLRKYTSLCKIFQRGIGNQMALPFSMNRSKSDGDFVQHYQNSENEERELIKSAFALDEDKLDAFSLTLDASEDKAAAAKYIQATNKRLIKLYQQWFNDLSVEDLI